MGPRARPVPVSGVRLSQQSVVTVSYRLTYRTNRPPAVTTTIQVTNRKGNKQYRFSEVNGVVTEQVINLS